MKFILVNVLSIVSLVCILACGSTGEPEIMEFSLLYNQREEVPFQENWLILQTYEEQHHIRFKVDVANDSEYILELQRRIESETIPDIILKLWPDEILGYATRNLLLPMSDYMEDMPYFQEYIQQNGLERELKKLHHEDGKIYLLPGYQRPIQPQQWIYRRDLFEKHGLGIPEDYDSLFDALVFLKELYPESSGITASWQGAHLFSMMGAGYGIPAGWNGNRLYDPDTDAWSYAPASENYRQMLIFLSRCYAAGILDPDIYTQSYSEYNEKLLQGEAFVTVSWISSGFASWNSQMIENGMEGGEWYPLPVPESTVGLRLLPPVDSFRKGLALSSRLQDDPRLPELIEFLDWAIYSEEGRQLTAWGVEGITFRKENGVPVFLENIHDPSHDGTTTDLVREYGLHTFFDLNEAPLYEDLRRPEEMVRFMLNSELRGEIPETAPVLMLDRVSLGAASTIEENILLYTQSSMKNFITGVWSPVGNWEAYLNELKKLGVETLTEIWNRAWESHRILSP